MRKPSTKGLNKSRWNWFRMNSGGFRHGDHDRVHASAGLPTSPRATGSESLDVVALLVTVLMILGPLAGAAFIVGRHGAGV